MFTVSHELLPFGTQLEAGFYGSGGWGD